MHPGSIAGIALPGTLELIGFRRHSHGPYTDTNMEPCRTNLYLPVFPDQLIYHGIFCI